MCVIYGYHETERRKTESARIREKYPDRIPVIVEKVEKSDIPDIDKKKYVSTHTTRDKMNGWKTGVSV